MNKEKWSPPGWMYRGRKPESDDAYLENMTRVIFLAGLSWKMIDEKWLNFKTAFKDFTADKISKMDEKEVDRLMSDASIIRNRAKIAATIKNAQQFQQVRKEHGSFRHYLESMDRSDNYTSVIKELGRRFNRLGPSSVRIFLYSIGEDMERPVECERLLTKSHSRQEKSPNI